jgi:hypothetical protein
VLLLLWLLSGCETYAERVSGRVYESADPATKSALLTAGEFQKMIAEGRASRNAYVPVAGVPIVMKFSSVTPQRSYTSIAGDDISDEDGRFGWCRPTHTLEAGWTSVHVEVPVVTWERPPGRDFSFVRLTPTVVGPEEIVVLVRRVDSDAGHQP